MNRLKRKQIFVVLGMHRNGTSLITRGLQVLGVDLGNHLLPPVSDNNEKGFWEDVDINALNIDILKALGQDWHSLQPIVEAELFSLPSIDQFKLRAVETLRNKLDNTNYFGLKDPRICRLLPFWQPVFEHLQLQVNYIIAYRNPMSVIHSLAKRDGFGHQKSYYLWLEHMIQSLMFTTKQQRLVVNYDSFIEDPEKQLQRIALKFGLAFTPQGSDYVEYKNNFIEEALRHTQYTVVDLELDKSVPPIVIEINKALIELSLDGAGFDDSDISLLVKLANQQLCENFSLLSYAQKLDEEVLLQTKTSMDLSAQIVSLTEALANRDAQISHLKQTNAGLTIQINNLNNQLSLIFSSNFFKLTKSFHLIVSKFLSSTRKVSSSCQTFFKEFNTGYQAGIQHAKHSNEIKTESTMNVVKNDELSN